jgi:Flp pilus assembly pilin Flp
VPEKEMVPMGIGRIVDRMKHFLRDDEGLVTLEWVAIAAAVIVLGIGVVIILQPSVNSAASSVGSNLLSAVNSNS